MIGLIGINYNSSPILVREKFTFNENQIIDFGTQLKSNSNVSGLVILSTCNRSEIYFQMEDCWDKEAFSFMLKSWKAFCGVTDSIREYFYFKTDTEVFKHLFYVVSGANSMVLGEDQIVGQVKQALQISQDSNISDTELNRLFTKSLEANKKIRNKTKINQGAFSVSYAGVEKCMSVFSDIQKCRILLVGAGETGTLTLKSLLKKGCQDIVITNRTFEKAENLASKYKVSACPISNLEVELESSDIVIVSTGSQVPLVTEQMTERVSQKRDNRKLLFIDLSVPRNVSAGVSAIPNVLVYDVDQLEEVVNKNTEKRKKLITAIDAIIEDYIVEFSDWLSSRKLGEVISTIKTNFSAVNQIELEGFKKVNKTVKDNLLDNYGTHITEKYTRLLIKNLKEVTNNGRKTEYVKVLNSLFNLN